MTVTTTDISYRRVDRNDIRCIGEALLACPGGAVWCRQWQTSAMAAPSFFYACDHHARRMAAADGIELPDANPYAVGSIFHTSWGYDQTNVEYYLVVRETAASVWLQELTRAEVRDGRLYPVLPEAGDKLGPTTMHRKGKHGVYVRMDYVRHAYPYTGGGCYDTYAAGGVGH